MTDFITITTNFTRFLVEFGYGKFLIEPFWYALAAYQTYLSHRVYFVIIIIFDVFFLCKAAC